MKIKNKRGMTLVELAVVMSVTGILVSIIVTSMSSLKIGAKLNSELKRIGAAIQTAQSYAIQGKNLPEETVCGYGFRFFGSSGEFEIFYNTLDSSVESCQAQNQDSGFRRHLSSSETSESFELENGIKLINPSNQDTEIYFDIPNANAYGHEGEAFPGLTLTLGLETGSSQKSINLNNKAYIAP